MHNERTLNEPDVIWEKPLGQTTPGDRLASELDRDTVKPVEALLLFFGGEFLLMDKSKIAAILARCMRPEIRTINDMFIPVEMRGDELILKVENGYVSATPEINGKTWAKLRLACHAFEILSPPDGKRKEHRQSFGTIQLDADEFAQSVKVATPNVAIERQLAFVAKMEREKRLAWEKWCSSQPPLPPQPNAGQIAAIAQALASMGAQPRAAR